MKKTDIRLWYCKADKKTGKPIMVQNLNDNTITKTNKIEYKNVNIKMAFNNAVGKAKGSGATTIMEVEFND